MCKTILCPIVAYKTWTLVFWSCFRVLKLEYKDQPRTAGYMFVSSVNAKRLRWLLIGPCMKNNEGRVPRKARTKRNEEDLEQNKIEGVQEDLRNLGVCSWKDTGSRRHCKEGQDTKQDFIYCNIQQLTGHKY